MSKKINNSKKKTAKFVNMPSIKPKPAFKKSSSVDKLAELAPQEWTGDSTPQYKGIRNLAPWPEHDHSKPESEEVKSTESHKNIVEKSGRSWPDFTYELLLGGNLVYPFLLIWILVFGLILYQDNSTGKLETMSGVIWSLSKGGMWAFVVFIVFGIVYLFKRK